MMAAGHRIKISDMKTGALRMEFSSGLKSSGVGEFNSSMFSDCFATQVR